jgi:hypothetical protein
MQSTNSLGISPTYCTGLRALQGKMATEDAEITHLRAQAKRLVGATQYSAISRFLDERMKADIHPNCFTEFVRLNREKRLVAECCLGS